MYNKFGVKELYEVNIKTTDNIVINGQTYEPDEVVMYFDKLQIENITGTSDVRDASGGKNDFSQIIWDTVKSVDFAFEDGLVSMLGLNFLTQSKSAVASTVTVPKREELITDANGKAVLSNAPAGNRSLFVYKISGGIITSKLTVLGIAGAKIDVGVANAYTSILVDYYFAQSNITYYEIGGENIKGFFKMTSKINFVDDKDGMKTTMLFVLPKVKILSNINLTFGVRANPIVSTFRLRALPDETGKTLARFIYLNQDIEG